MSRGWKRFGSQISKVRLLSSYSRVKNMVYVKKPALNKSSLMNRLSGFLLGLSLGKYDDEVMTDGISGA